MKTQFKTIPILLGACFALAMPLVGQRNPFIDATDYKPAHLGTNANIDFTTRTMEIGFFRVGYNYGPATTADSVMREFVKKVTKGYVDYDDPNVWLDISKTIISYPDTTFTTTEHPECYNLPSSPSIESWWANLQNSPGIMDTTEISSAFKNVYKFYAPVSGNYSIAVNLPGHPSGIQNTVRCLRPSFDILKDVPLMSGLFYVDVKNFPLPTYLPAGVNLVVIETIPADLSVTVDCGDLNSVKLAEEDKSNLHQFTLANVPVIYEKMNLADYLKEVGARDPIPVPYELKRPSCLINGELKHRRLYPKVFWVHEIFFPCVSDGGGFLPPPPPTYTLLMDVEEYAYPTLGFINYDLPPDLDADVMMEFSTDPFLAGIIRDPWIIKRNKTAYFYFLRLQDQAVPDRGIAW
jgi:hypothetical protein